MHMYCQCHQSLETKGHMYGQKPKGHASFYLLDMYLPNAHVLSMSSKSGDKRTYVWAKAKRTCVLLPIGEQEREIQNAQVNSIKVRRQKKSDL